MEWTDDALILGARRYGETSVILEVMSRRHGRHLGLVKGGRSRRLQPLLQPGNGAEVTWRARIEEHLGAFAVEATRLRAADLMAAPGSLHGLNLVAALLRLLPEREPHETLYERAEAVLDSLEAIQHAPASLVRLEMALLGESGFGLDLATCAATGRTDDLVFVSPRSARAVSREAGAPYRDRLLPLPTFLKEGADAEPGPADIHAGFALTGYFLMRDMLAPRGLPMPPARDALVAQLRSLSAELA